MKDVIAKARNVEREEAAAMHAEGNMRAAKRRTETEADARSQSEKFVQAAREMGLDEREVAFDAALTKVARHKPMNAKIHERE